MDEKEKIFKILLENDRRKLTINEKEKILKLVWKLIEKN